MATKSVGQGGKVSRDERKRQIMEMLKGEDYGLTTHAIARRLGLAPSPYVRALVYEMLWQELIVGDRRLMKNRRWVYCWYDKDNANRKMQGQMFYV